MPDTRLQTRRILTRRAAAASLATAATLAIVKLYASLETGSVAMLGSLADTGLDLIAACVTLIGVRVASEPADAEHRFGHGKAEAIAAFLQTIFITLSAIGIGWHAVSRLTEPQAPTSPELGIGVSAFAIVLTLALVAYQRSIVRRTSSLAIDADRMHYQSDLLLNLSVIAALILDAMLNVRGVDAVFGLIIAGWLAWGAFNTSGRALDMLMDREWTGDKRLQLENIINAVPGIEGFHELKTRHAGHTDFIQFHIWVDPEMTVRVSHDIVDVLMARINASFPDADVLVHVDPRGK